MVKLGSKVDFKILNFFIQSIFIEDLQSIFIEDLQTTKYFTKSHTALRDENRLLSYINKILCSF